MTPPRIHAIMADQDGVLTYEQATGAGMSDSAISRRVCSGDWRRLAQGVYLRADRQYGPPARLRAAVFTAGAGATAYGPSAVWWHGIRERAPDAAWVSIPADRKLRAKQGIHLRRRDLDAADVVTYRGLRTTAVPLSVLEAAVVLPDGAVMMDRALQTRVTLPMLQNAHDRNPGRRGSVAAAALLHSAGEGGASEAERMLVRILRKAGIGGWHQHYKSRGFEIDTVFLRERVAIEVDGWAWHRDAARFVADAERQNILVNDGWHVLRFTWHQLKGDPAKVLAAIRTALTR